METVLLKITLEKGFPMFIFVFGFFLNVYVRSHEYDKFGSLHASGTSLTCMRLQASWLR